MALEPEPGVVKDSKGRLKVGGDGWYGFDDDNIAWEDKGENAQKALKVGDIKYTSSAKLKEAQSKKKNENVEKKSDKKADPKTIDKGKKNNKKNSK